MDGCWILFWKNNRKNNPGWTNTTKTLKEMECFEENVWQIHTFRCRLTGFVCLIEAKRSIEPQSLRMCPSTFPAVACVGCCLLYRTTRWRLHKQWTINSQFLAQINKMIYIILSPSFSLSGTRYVTLHKNNDFSSWLALLSLLQTFQVRNEPKEQHAYKCSKHLPDLLSFHHRQSKMGVLHGSAEAIRR